MKSNFTFFFTALIVFFGLSQLSAQDTLVVEWSLDGGTTIAKNNLRNVILADTGRPVGRVYKLRQGGYYQISDRIENSGFHLRIVGETAGALETENPPVIQMTPRPDLTVDGRILTGLNDVTIKNVWITGISTLGAQGSYQPMQMDASNKRFEFDNCIFDRSNFAMLAWTNKNNVIKITNCTFRNLIGSPSSQQWEGRAISIWANQDSVIIENNTFFNIGMCVLQIESGSAKYVLFNHNTIVNLGRSLLAGNWWQEAYFANNLFVNSWWHGEGRNDYTSSGRDPRAYNSGIFSIGDLPSAYGPEEGRRVLFANAAAYIAPEFTTHYADTIRYASFIDPVSREDHLAMYLNQVVADTVWADPGLKWVKDGMPADPSVQSLYPDMIQNITDLRAGVTPAQPYFWRLVEESGGGLCYECVSWPLPEDFSYTNSQLLTAGTDGLPLGDLNWFPNKKAEYLADRDKNIEDIVKLAGPIIKYDVVDEEQGEKGTVSGGASVLLAQGTTYYQMSGGYIQWVFDLTTAAQYDIDVYVDLNNRATSGVNFFVNGFEIHDPRGWGQYVFGNDATSVYPTFPISGLNWWLIKESETKEAASLPLHLLAGSDTITIRASWCNNGFGGIKIYEAGTTTLVKELTAADVTQYSLASPRILGAPWTPLWFKSAALGTNGTVTLSLNAPTDGQYVIQPFYQNYSGTSSGAISADGIVVGTYNFESDVDSTGLSGLSTVFPLTAGDHQIALSGTDVQVDYIQLIQKSIVDVKNEQLPEGYSLEQNYPNPFNPSTKINYKIATASNVKLNIYNILGQKVATLVNQFMNAGAYSVDFNASHLASGVYIYKLEAGDFSVNKKMMLLK